LNLKKVRLQMLSDEPLKLSLKIKGVKDVKASDIVIPGQVVVLNPDQHIASITDKNTELDIELTVEKGLGYVPKEVHQKDKVDIGTIALDANFTPIQRVNYDVELMRVGNRTDFNRLRIAVETDGTLSPREALEKSIETMVNQLKAIIGFKDDDFASSLTPASDGIVGEEKMSEGSGEDYEDFLKTRTESLNLSQRTINALTNANIRTVGGLARKKEKDILEIEGLGSKGVEEIKDMLAEHNITLK
jgi:DNA-directed RNA polymerase subunit alpha